MEAKTKRNIGKAVLFGLPTAACIFGLTRKGSTGDKIFMGVVYGILTTFIALPIALVVAPKTSASASGNEETDRKGFAIGHTRNK